MGYEYRVVNEGVGVCNKHFGVVVSEFFLLQSFRMVVRRPLQYLLLLLSYAAVVYVDIHFHLQPPCAAMAPW